MSYLRDETEPSTTPQRVWSGVIASPAADMLDRVDVVIPGLSEDMRWQDCRWQSKDNKSLPQVGNECLVAMDDNGEMWVTAWWATPAKTPYGTSLPTSPYDDQEAILVDSVTNPTYQWRFRYNGGSTSTYKWEFVGGPPIVAGPLGSISNVQNSTGQVDLTGGPTVTLPRAGDYEILVGAFISNGGTLSGACIGSAIAVVGSTALVNATMYCGIAWQSVDVSKIAKALGRAAGDVVKIQVTNNGGATQLLGFSNANLVVTPLRVS